MSDQYPPNGGAPTGPEPAPSAPYAQPSAAPGYGSLGKRFLARIIDGLIVGIPINIILAVLPGLRLGGIVANAVLSVAGFAYFLVLETSSGATLGKQLLGMKVTNEGGGAPISMDASMRRNWWVLLGVLGGVPIIGWLTSLASLAVVILIATTISSSPRNQGWHDKMAGTLVVDKDFVPAAAPPQV